MYYCPRFIYIYIYIYIYISYVLAIYLWKKGFVWMFRICNTILLIRAVNCVSFWHMRKLEACYYLHKQSLHTLGVVLLVMLWCLASQWPYICLCWRIDETFNVFFRGMYPIILVLFLLVHYSNNQNSFLSFPFKNLYCNDMY